MPAADSPALRDDRAAAPITRQTKIADLPELLRVEEAAAYLGVSKGLAYELARRGDLQSVRLGRLLRIRRDGLDAAHRVTEPAR